MISGTSSWVCDLLKDVESGRAPGDLALPASTAALEILSAPFPPTFGSDIRLGRGVDAINHTCDKRVYTLRVGFPTHSELIEGLLLDKGFTIAKDEKRVRYDQAFLMFENLDAAARAVSGAFGKAVNALAGKKNTGSRPLRACDISRAVGKLPDPEDSQMARLLDTFTSGHTRRIAKERFSKYYEAQTGRSSSPLELLETLCRMSVLEHRWMFRCKFCDKSYWGRRLNFEQVTRCPGCRERVIFGNKLELGYELNELLALAIREGWGPVAQTARFLDNLTRRGFSWLPGVKCSMGDTQFDFDLLALCDGHLVAAECKTLLGTALTADWSGIADQVQRELKGAVAAGAELFVVASQLDEYPEAMVTTVESGAPIPLLWLVRKDLEDGRRLYRDHRGYVWIHDVIPPRREEVCRYRHPKKRKQRQTQRFTAFGFGTLRY
jgi:hypothetical protein